MNENEFQNYQFLEMASVLSLNGIWKLLREKLNEKISIIKNCDYLDYDSINTLQQGLDDFDKIISKLNSRSEEPQQKKAQKQKTSKTGTTRIQRTENELFEEFMEDYFEWEQKRIDNIVMELPKIFTTILTSFLIDIDFISIDNKDKKQNNFQKFKLCNIVMRYPRDQDKKMLKEKKCDIDYGIELLFNSDSKYVYQQSLMHGFDRVESMIQGLRNGTAHRDDKDALKILKTFDRTVEDPVSQTPTFGNIVTLCSILILCSYQFDEIIQTWIDTNTFVKNSN